MQIFLIILFLFLVGCIIGWVIEVFFRRYFTVKKWVNPGFMKGPWLPLYGFGVVVMFTMSYLCVSFFPESIRFYNPLGGLFERDYTSGPNINDLIPIALMWIGMVALEFFAGLIFIKGFHVKLWDYSNMKGNIMGIICPVFNVIWLSLAVLFYYAINPFLYVVSTNMHTYMFGGEGSVAHFGFIFVMGIAYGIMIWDFVSSIGLFAAVTKFAKSSGVLERYEIQKERWDEATKEAKKALFNFLPLKERKKKKNPNLAQVKEKIANAIYIDPEKEKEKAKNYDENGRPIKIEDK